MVRKCRSAWQFMLICSSLMDMADILELCCAARACMQLYRKTSKSKRSERYLWRIWSYHAHVASKCTSFSVSPLHRGHRNITAFSSVYRRLCVSIWLIPSLNVAKAFHICWFYITSKYFSFSQALLKVLYTSYLPLDSSLEYRFWMKVFKTLLEFSQETCFVSHWSIPPSKGETIRAQ